MIVGQAKTAEKPNTETPEADPLAQAREEGAAIVAETRAAAEAVLAEARQAAETMLADARASAVELAAAAPAGAPVDLGALVEALRESRKEDASEIERARARERTVAKPEDVEEGFEPVVFRSRGINFSIVRVPRHRWTATNGEAQVTDGVRYEFAHGRGDLVVRNAEVADYIRSRPSFNVEVWEVGKEPHAAPDPARELDRIMQAGFDLDLGALAEIEEKERASFNRKVIIDAIAAAKRQIQKVSEEG
jgi:hypothetical protein